MKRKNPDTSVEAYRSLQAGELSETYGKIVFALRNIKSGTTEQIAASLKIKHEKIWKRVSELHIMGIIFRPGHKLPTSSGRMAYVWQLVENPETDVQKTEPKPIGISKYAESIDKIKQSTLF